MYMKVAAKHHMVKFILNPYRMMDMRSLWIEGILMHPLFHRLRTIRNKINTDQIPTENINSNPSYQKQTLFRILSMLSS